MDRYASAIKSLTWKTKQSKSYTVLFDLIADSHHPLPPLLLLLHFLPPPASSQVSVTGADGAISKYFVSSGTVTVNADSSVQLLAEEACLVADLDVRRLP